MGTLIDLVGMRFGMLKVLALYSGGKTSKWSCLCDCGNQCIVSSQGLRKGTSHSCRCDRGRNISLGKLTHGGYFENKRLAGIWDKMRRRCQDPKDSSYLNYGGRGIKVYAKWNNLRVFFDWALKNGYANNLTIDRIDNDGNYKPSNCRWVTLKENNQNRSNTLGHEKVKEIKLLLQAGKETVRSIAKIYGVSHTAIVGINTGRYYSNLI